MAGSLTYVLAILQPCHGIAFTAGTGTGINNDGGRSTHACHGEKNVPDAASPMALAPGLHDYRGAALLKL